MNDFGLIFSSVVSTLGSIHVLVAVFVGTFVGLVFGALPGLTATMGVALLIPLTFTLNPVEALGMLVGTYSAASRAVRFRPS